MKNLSYLCKHQTKGHEKNRIHHQHLNVWERNYRDCGAKIRRFMEVTKQFLEKVFSTKRMERYFALYPDDEAKVIGWMNATCQNGWKRKNGLGLCVQKSAGGWIGTKNRRGLLIHFDTEEREAVPTSVGLGFPFALFIHLYTIVPLSHHAPAPLSCTSQGVCPPVSIILLSPQYKS